MATPNDARQAGSYVDGGNGNVYAFNPGVCVLPLAEDPPVLDGSNAAEVAAYSPVVVLRLHAPYRERSFVQTATKQSNPPPVAAPGDAGRFVFLGGTVGISTALNLSYANYDWSVSCRYSYIEACVSRNQDGLVLGTGTFDTTIDVQNRQDKGYGYPNPPIGAVASAGPSARCGYIMGQQLLDGQGNLVPLWAYNQVAFYPGTLFYDDSANGGA